MFRRRSKSRADDARARLRQERRIIRIARSVVHLLDEAIEIGCNIACDVDRAALLEHYGQHGLTSQLLNDVGPALVSVYAYSENNSLLVSALLRSQHLLFATNNKLSLARLLNQQNKVFFSLPLVCCVTNVCSVFELPVVAVHVTLFCYRVGCLC
jgi:hypothetical protein